MRDNEIKKLTEKSKKRLNIAKKMFNEKEFDIGFKSVQAAFCPVIKRLSNVPYALFLGRTCGGKEEIATIMEGKCRRNCWKAS